MDVFVNKLPFIGNEHGLPVFIRGDDGKGFNAYTQSTRAFRCDIFKPNMNLLDGNMNIIDHPRYRAACIAITALI